MNGSVRGSQLWAAGESLLNNVGLANHVRAYVSPACLPASCLPACVPACRGRLFNQIRSREGLAYSVSGGWASTPTDHPGLFLATAETAQPAALLAALRSALEGAIVEAPTPEELQRAKQASGCRPGTACYLVPWLATVAGGVASALPGHTRPIL